jgi:hypothetical protein
MLKQSIILVLTKSIGMIFAFLNSLFLLQYVNEGIRGYYFTFLSIATFASVFELGISTVIGQFLAHEAAHFSIKKSQITGSLTHLHRFFDILTTTIIWYLKVFAFGFFIIFFVGFTIFYLRNKEFQIWLAPWFLFLIFTLLNIVVELMFTASYVIFDIIRIQIFRAISMFLSYIICWILILLNRDNSLILVSAIPLFLCMLNIGIGVILYSEIFLGIFKKTSSDFNWKSEVFELQKKTAISFASGAFIYQLFTPTMFIFQGNEAAARVGVSFQFASAVPGIANYLIGIQSLKLAGFFAKKDYPDAKIYFKKIAILVFLILIMGLIPIFFIYLFPFSSKFVDKWEFITIYIALSLNSGIYLLASFSRSQKIENFASFSVAFGCINLFIIPISTYLYSSSGQITAFLIVTIFIALPISSIIFSKNYLSVK